MGFDFTNENGAYLRFSPSGWALALTLAGQYDWRPEGTSLPGSDESEPAEWSGEYATNDGQRVSASDANAIADACERALADPAYQVTALQTLNEINESVAAQVPRYEPERAIEPDVAKKFRDRLRELIEFCRSGGFVIS